MIINYTPIFEKEKIAIKTILEIPTNFKPDISIQNTTIPIIENLAQKCNKIDPNIVYDIINKKNRKLTIATISLYRYELLFKTLKHSSKLINTPLNICLRIQAAEEMNLEQKHEILEIINKYYNLSDVQFTYKNHGSGVPRHDVVQRAIYNLESDYIITLDDDILMPQYSLEIMMAILEKDTELGAINLWLDPWFAGWKSEDTKLSRLQMTPPYCLVDATGSGSMMIRKEVFETCNLDPNYYIGWGDTDFCMQMRKVGWKIGVLCIPGFKGFNIGTKDKKYLSIRHNKVHTDASKLRFFNKWGKSIG